MTDNEIELKYDIHKIELPPNRDIIICVYCKIKTNLVEFNKDKFEYKFKCPKCENHFYMEMDSKIKLLMRKYPNFTELYINEINKICHHLKKRHNIATLKIQSLLEQFKTLKEKSDYLNRINNYLDKIEYLERMGIDENNEQYNKLINCWCFKYRYKYFSMICIKYGGCKDLKICFKPEFIENYYNKTIKIQKELEQ